MAATILVACACGAARSTPRRSIIINITAFPKRVILTRSISRNPYPITLSAAKNVIARKLIRLTFHLFVAYLARNELAIPSRMSLFYPRSRYPNAITRFIAKTMAVSLYTKTNDIKHYSASRTFYRLSLIMRVIFPGYSFLPIIAALDATKKHTMRVDVGYFSQYIRITFRAINSTLFRLGIILAQSIYRIPRSATGGATKVMLCTLYYAFGLAELFTAILANNSNDRHKTPPSCARLVQGSPQQLGGTRSIPQIIRAANPEHLHYSTFARISP